MLDERPGILVGQEPPDRLGRVGEPGVVTVDEGASHDGCGGARAAAADEGRLEGVHDGEADGALGLGAIPVQGHGWDHVRGELVLDQQVADLGAVAVGDDDLVPGGDEIGHALHGAGDGGALGLRGG